jgi:drug/metabolite transporter (DMT)-like permease
VTQLLTGVALAAISAVLFNLGMVLQKQGAVSQRGLSHFSLTWVRGYLRSRRWLAGTGITLVGYCLEFLAFGLAPFVLVQPVYTAGMSTLAIFAVFIAKERFTRLEWIGVTAAVTGAVLVSASARPEADLVGFEKISYGRIGVLLVVTLVFSAGLFWLGSSFQKLSEVTIGLAAGVGFTACEVLTKALSIEALHGPARASIGLLTEGRVLGLVAALAFFASVATYYLQAGFERGRALIVGGVMGLSADMLPLFSGLAVFGEKLTSLGWATTLRSIGLALALGGAATVAFAPSTGHLLEALSKQESLVGDIRDRMMPPVGMPPVEEAGASPHGFGNPTETPLDMGVGPDVGDKRASGAT